MINRFYVVWLCLILAIPQVSTAQYNTGAAQKATGIAWTAPQNDKRAKKQLRFFSELGFKYVQISKPLSKTVWNTIDTLNYHVFATLPVKFPIRQTFTQADSSFKQFLKKRLQYYAAHRSVQAIGLYTYGADGKYTFNQKARSFFSPLITKIDLPFYHVTKNAGRSSHNPLLSFEIVRVNNLKYTADSTAGAYLLVLGKDDNHANLKAIKHGLMTYTKSVPVFFRAEGLLHLFNRFPNLKNTFKHYTSIKNDVIIFPEVNKNYHASGNVIILLLLFTWIILSITYYISPVYRQSMHRYFLAHRFFMKDVLNRHTRTMLPGISILVQQVLMSGIILFCTGNTLFSPLGREALFYHYPFLSIFGEGRFSFLFWGFVISFILETLFILWQRVGNPTFTHMSQIFNLYPWVLQINILFTTVIAVLYVSGASNTLIYTLGIICLVIFFAPFIIISTDTVNFLSQEHRTRTIGLTTVLYGVILIGSLIWIFFSPFLLNVFELAVTL